MTLDREKIIICSRCLGFAACRYDGSIVENNFISELSKKIKILPICPEVEIGLPAPRKKIMLVKNKKKNRLLQEKTGLDLTSKMNDFIESFFEDYLQKENPKIAGFILKSRSPSCGIKDCKIYKIVQQKEDKENNDEQKEQEERKTKLKQAGKEDGLFAAAAKKYYPETPMINEKQLQNKDTRSRFYEKIYEMDCK